MKLFVETCVTAIKRYGYSWNETDISKELKLVRDVENEFDKNAVKVFLNDKHIGFIKKQEALLLSPILKTNDFYVKKWNKVKHTDGYLIIQVILLKKH